MGTCYLFQAEGNLRTQTKRSVSANNLASRSGLGCIASEFRISRAAHSLA